MQDNVRMKSIFTKAAMNAFMQTMCGVITKKMWAKPTLDTFLI